MRIYTNIVTTTRGKIMLKKVMFLVILSILAFSCSEDEKSNPVSNNSGNDNDTGTVKTITIMGQEISTTENLNPNDVNILILMNKTHIMSPQPIEDFGIVKAVFVDPSDLSTSIDAGEVTINNEILNRDVIYNPFTYDSIYNYADIDYTIDPGKVYNWSIQGAEKQPPFDLSLAAPKGDAIITSHIWNFKAFKSSGLTIKWKTPTQDEEITVVTIIDQRNNKIYKLAEKPDECTFTKSELETLYPGVVNIQINKQNFVLLNYDGKHYAYAVVVFTCMIEGSLL